MYPNGKHNKKVCSRGIVFIDNEPKSADTQRPNTDNQFSKAFSLLSSSQMLFSHYDSFRDEI